MDRELVAFFALAFALAWGVYGILGVIGWASGGVTATELLTRGELLDFEESTSSFLASSSSPSLASPTSRSLSPVWC
ncbi:hypothetical protein [Halosegnis marinus]|uniref:hypothetical protein n=1 Tax=Halosegnis marinus TaxID=3034023 RepID=UPI00362262F4